MGFFQLQNISLCKPVIDASSLSYCRNTNLDIKLVGSVRRPSIIKEKEVEYLRSLKSLRTSITKFESENAENESEKMPK
jgi:hypothetical protein